jgi:hypothetical protein
MLVALLIACLFASLALAQQVGQHGKLRVSPNHRFLEYEDGAPFLYLGDTAWQLFQRLTREETDLYLKNRAEKGFTVIQAVVLQAGKDLTAPNAYGDPPLAGSDPTKPNEAYFRHVDYAVAKARELGLFVGMVPTWGGNWQRYDKKPPYVFDRNNARVYGRYLGQRYKDEPIIWILGGDALVHLEEEKEIISAMAEGLREGDGGAHLITFHPRGPGQSSDYFHQARWLDFNMNQSSHGAHDHDNGLLIEHDYSLKPPKPTVDGEPRYETMSVGFYYKNASRMDRFDDYDVRQAAYWSMLAGACGHTYGNNSVWQFWTPSREPAFYVNVPWRSSLNHAGAFQMGYLRTLFESRPYQKLIPDQAIIIDGPRQGGAKIRAAVANDSSFAFFYSPRGENFTVDRSRIRGPRIREIWYDPRYGASYDVHTTDNTTFQTYTPPTAGRGNDWILIIEDVSENFPLPGMQ